MRASDLVAHIARVQARSAEAAALLRDQDIAWRPRPGELTAGEIVLHIAAARMMNLDMLAGRPPRFAGHEVPTGATAASVRETLALSAEASARELASLDIDGTIRSLSSGAVPAWQAVLGGLVEHEVHHRSQLCEYLSALGIGAPPLFGLHAEDLPR